MPDGTPLLGPGPGAEAARGDRSSLSPLSLLSLSLCALPSSLSPPPSLSPAHVPHSPCGGAAGGLACSFSLLLPPCA
eukprot:3935874-Rhodomonas_salina.4